MTAFTKENISIEGRGETWIFYVGNGERRFIARFKSGRGGYGTFVTFLKKNFTVEEYFDMRGEDGQEKMTPAAILESKGYASPNQLKAMKRLGVTRVADLGAALTAEYYRLKEERENPKPITLVYI